MKSISPQVLRLKQGFVHSLSAQMMTPIQRVTRFQLLLREIEKSFEQSGRPELHRAALEAYEAAHEIANYANDMMCAGRISGFHVKLKRGK